MSDPYKLFRAPLQFPFVFEYQGLRFSQQDFHLFLGLNTVDTPQNTQKMMKTVQENNLTCTRMGAYKPRTSPYTFPGQGAQCLESVFDLAGRYGIKIIAMEVTHERHIEEIDSTLERLGRPTGVILQIGTRNAQNFELLRAVGQQKTYPVLYKRGFGITLAESLSAAEYIIAHGNEKIIFCLRGVKSLFAAPHRNLVDFSQVPTLKRMIRSPICVDPSHAIGERLPNPDGICDVFHAAAQGVIAGANMLLVDFHPTPSAALVDSRQTISTAELPLFLEDMRLCRETYLARCRIHEKMGALDGEYA
jgi:3-deoxy-7-phosphoheptulonate synthase